MQALTSTNQPDIYVDYTFQKKDPQTSFLTKAFHRTFANTPSGIQAMLSVTAFVQNFLQEAHNTFSESNIFVKGLAGFGIELGFIANTFIIGPAEILIRTAVAPVFALLGLALLCCCDDADEDSPGTNLIAWAIGAPIVAALQMGQSAVSAFYSHPTFINRNIDNHGQALCHIFCTAPNKQEEPAVVDEVVL